MKKVIDGLVYNTDTGILLATKGTGYTANFSDWYENLYITKKGRFFVNYWGGAATQFAERYNNGRTASEGSGICTLTKDEALDFLNDAEVKEIAEEYFDFEEA